MIAFASLYLGLGLITGVQQVELLVDPTVAAVELQLDGETVARISAPPWEASVDLGDQLEPMELRALARDEAGEQVGDATLWVNLPSDPAETRILLEGGEDGRGVVARLTWRSTTGVDPVGAEVIFDGVPLEVADPRSFVLPDHDPAQLHFLRAELDFPRNVVSVAEITFGGTYTDEVDAELTAVPIALDGRRRIRPEELAGALRTPAGELEIVTIEEGPVEIVVVVAEEARDRLVELTSELRRQRTRQGRARSQVPSPRDLALLREGQTVRILPPWAEVRRNPDGFFKAFPPPGQFDRDDGGLLWLILNSPTGRPEDSPQRLADAVAVAGMGAASRGRRRAVVLVTMSGAADESEYEPATVRHYLSALRVPLEVWALEPEAAAVADWGATETVPGLAGLERRFRDLGRRLERQRMVWVRGLHRPAAVSFAHPVEGVRIEG